MDDNSDEIRDMEEWYTLDYVYLYDGWFVMAGGIDDYWDDGYYWFAPVGPGVYSLGLGGWVEADATGPVPAPGALVLGGLGAAVVGWLRRRGTV